MGKCQYYHHQGATATLVVRVSLVLIKQAIKTNATALLPLFGFYWFDLPGIPKTSTVSVTITKSFNDKWLERYASFEVNSQSKLENTNTRNWATYCNVPSQLAHELIIHIMQKSFCSNSYQNNPIRLQFCTCQGSSAAMACAKLWLDLIIIFHVKAICIVTSFGWCAHEPFVSWSPGLDSGQLAAPGSGPQQVAPHQWQTTNHSTEK